MQYLIDSTEISSYLLTFFMLLMFSDWDSHVKRSLITEHPGAGFFFHFDLFFSGKIYII